MPVCAHPDSSRRQFLLTSLPLLGASTWSGAARAGQVPAAPAARPQLDLSGYQTRDGLIGTFRDGNAADPYFGLYALELAEKGGLAVHDARSRFIQWGLSEQRPDGRFERYCRPDARWQRCGRSDSDDATLARWVLLLHTAAAGELPAAWEASAARALEALLALRMRNGIYSVFAHNTPGYRGYALFKDNVEVLSAFEQLAHLYLHKDKPDAAQHWARRAARLREAMGRHFGTDPFSMKRFALGANYRGWRFYPHAVATPFGWLEGYFDPPSPGQWARWLREHREAWLANAKTDFPWGLIALAALHTAPGSSEPRCWLERFGAQRAANIRWNVLEEVCAQVIEHAPVATSSPRSCTAPNT